ncbi:MAG: HDOD domain-containing protein [Gammaproteobacteria bacterium]|nr:HDOD domain-containing protein [Rhodocyclaceae bacterium]MBU3909848.1 HDOD domain-containing protein [Gammaproteobacteria bacterium]MBU4003573.1 HDOD domain-containing protein [Gammaproteobacteria bacterium]MBU4020068.1 HDOD domain-containing protein [Gammaproteobacteria bacterium]MBU4095192.1 HDOD domain-containing protein [Gammaproteobacteria bacterium]
MNQNIGRFEIRGELGRGAQSVVYLAWDPQLQREVAIKTLHFSRADPARNALLLDEARMVGKFRHPHVVPIYDAGEQDGDPYLVFERVVGRNLADALKSDGPLSAIRAATLMLQIADVLAEAHALGIIHRDLKPSNIFLDVRDGAPRVMDFGIASQVAAEGSTEGQALMGTPPYLAPEYITLQRITPQADIFAAGLVLLEMLTGKRVFDGGTVDSILYRIACEPVTLPKEPAIDPRLGGIILRACALDPSLRYASAAELRDALNSFLGEGTADRVAGQAAIAQGDTLDFLLRRMRHKSDFPALSESVSAINKLTAAEGESVTALSNTILKDYALTNKILRLVNSAYYRQAGGGNISTVSRAVIVLGFDTIRNIALTVLLFEHLQDKANAHELKEAFLRANLAGLVAKDICQSPLLKRQGEEVFICALFHGLGQLLAQYYFPEEVEEINKRVQFGKLSVRAASTEILGISFEDLGIGIAGNWGFPPTIVDSMRSLPLDEVARKPNTSGEALRVAAAFGNELCGLVSATPPEQRDKVLRKISLRFGASLQITDRQVQAAIEKSVLELSQLASVLRVNIKQSPFARHVAAFASGAADTDECLSLSAVAEPDQLAATLLGESALLDGQEDTATAGVPDDAQAVLTAGIQDISNSLVEDFALNDMLRIILETIYRAMGFKRVLLALRDPKSGRMTGRFGLGPEVNELVQQFRFPLSSLVNDVFLLATGRGLDIIINDIDDPKIADKVPQWFRERIPAKTFVLFPLNMKGKPVALIYCDKDKAGSINIPEKELTLLKTLRNQALLAIKQAT